jgi:CMP-N-acetylneuraminic acid synthetase
MKEISAIVPVRKGSIRVKNKNMRPFGGSSLLEIKINKLKKVKGISEIIVSSDCEEMLVTARNLGVSYHRREDYFASAEATNSEFFENLGDIATTDCIMYSPVTCPFVSLETYSECIDSFATHSNVVTASLVKHHLWLNGKPLNYDIKNSPNSQDLPDIYRITYGVSLISKADLLEYKNIVTETPYFKVLDEIESVDIDTEFDFLLAEEIYKRMS